MPIVQRFFHQESPDDGPGAGEATPLANNLDKRVVVILGGPGIGKTTELKQAAEQEADATFCKVSHFLADPIERYQGKAIYLDALDEHRAENHQGVSIIDAIRGRLLQLDCPMVRLSCRGEEWQQGSDVNSLSAAAGGEPVYILRMQPLRALDIRAIVREQIADVDAFLAGAEERQLEESLGNPETLKLYLRVYRSGGDWPRTRAELMEQSTRLLISEENEQHERARGGEINDDRLIRAAEDLSAILLFGDKEGAALSRPAGSDFFVPLQELSNIDLDAANLVARRRLFSSDAPEQVYPQHKTTGDYLASKALVRRIQGKSLPLGRALSLVTGKDGGPLSHMRDVYAWLIALLPDHAEQLIKADPCGVMIYGDVGQWLVPTRRMALKYLSAYAANKDPWFRAGSWYAPLLGALVHPGLVEDFRDILRNEPSPHVTSVVLSALEYGNVLPELGDDLLSFIRDPGRPQHDWLRDDALRVFTRVCPERTRERKALLVQVKEGVIPDEDHLLRGVLLSELYPVEIGPHEVVHFLASADIGGLMTMSWFIRRDLLEKTPDADLPRLADAILANPNDIKPLHEFDRRALNGALVSRLLETYESTTPPDQIYGWLGIYLDRYSESYLDADDAKYIRTFIESCPTLYEGLFRSWLGRTVPEKGQNLTFHHYEFRQRILSASAPPDFPEVLLGWAAAESDIDKANFLFEEAVDLTMRGNTAASRARFEGLFEYVETHPIFSDSWERMRTTTVPDWRWRQANSKREHYEQRERKRADALRILLPRLEDLRNGWDSQNLNFGAMHWFGLIATPDEEVEPLQRVSQQTNDQIAEAMAQGFEALLGMDSPHTPEDILILNRKMRRHFQCFPVLAGAEIVAARSLEEFLDLPKPNIKAALAYRMVHPLGDRLGSWDEQILSVYPELGGEVLANVWRAELAGGEKERLTGAYVESARSVSTPIILSETENLLEENPALPSRILKSSLIAILLHGDPEGLRRLVPLALNDNRVRGECRTLWLAIAAIFSPAANAGKLDRRLRSRASEPWLAFGILIAGTGGLRDDVEKVAFLQMALSILCKLFNKVPSSVGTRSVGNWDPEDAARSIRGMTDALAGMASEEAAQAFVALVSDPALHEWHDDFRHCRMMQAANLRDAQFERPSVQDVCSILAGGAPVSMVDFQALAIDILDDICTKIRGDNANMWKSFWTLATKGDLDRPKIENDSRDAILPWIGPYLTAKGITVEPEAAAADQKRVDIRLTCAETGTLPIEIKRDDNDELWIAMRDQLLERYTNDPSTGGYGIYLVLWYGRAGNGCKAPPKELGIDTPHTALELWGSLEEIKPDPRFAVRVIDVSKPHG